MCPVPEAGQIFVDGSRNRSDGVLPELPEAGERGGHQEAGQPVTATDAGRQAGDSLLDHWRDPERTGTSGGCLQRGRPAPVYGVNEFSE